MPSTAGRGDGNYVASFCDVRPHTHVNSPLHVYRDVSIFEDIDGVNWRGSPWVSVGKWDRLCTDDERAVI